MNSSKSIYRIFGVALLALGLLVLLSVPVLAQNADQHEHEESLNWYQQLGSAQGLAEQFKSNPVLFFATMFALGIATSLTPCVLPMIPITLSIVTGIKQEVAGRSWAKSTLTGLGNSLVYVLGVSITYAVLGVLAAMVGVGVRGFLESCSARIIFGIVFAILGLSMIGLFSLPLPGWGRSKVDAAIQRQKSKKSLLTVFILGLFSGIIASPCVVPVIGALLLWISTAGIWIGWWALFVFGWGMGLLLIVVGLTGWTISSGKWMVTVKGILGTLLVLVAAWFVVRGIQCKGIIPAWLLGGSGQQTTTTKTGAGKIEWIYSEPQGLALAKKANKPVMIDFYADWCSYCVLIEQTTFQDKRVIKELSRFVLIKVDITDDTPETLALTRKYRVMAPPAFIFFNSEGKVGVLPGYVPTEDFLEILKKVK